MKPVALCNSTPKDSPSLYTKNDEKLSFITVTLYLRALLSLPDKVVIAYEQQVLQYREEIRLGSAVLYHALHHIEHIPGISAQSQGLVHNVKQ